MSDTPNKQTPKPSPTEISAAQLTKLMDHLNATLNCFDTEDDINWDQINRNIAGHVGHWYMNYQGLLMRERMKMSEINERVSLSRAAAYNDIKRTKQYDLDSNGMKLFTQGAESVREIERERENQEAYIKFLESALDHIKFYPNAIKTMVAVYEAKHRY
jgi:predicted DNA-binding protein YlxM (UPF0122 family)